MSDAVADMVMSAIRGGQEAQQVVQEVGAGCAQPDALHDALLAVLASNNPHRLRAWLRRIQKALESGGH